MSVAPINTPSAMAGVGQVSDLPVVTRAKSTQLKGAALRQAAPAEQRAAVAAQFEAILVRQLLGKTMNSMLGGAEGGVSGSIYGDMLADTIAQQLTAGPGLGIGRMLEQQLTPRGELGPAPNRPAAPDRSDAGTTP